MEKDANNSKKKKKERRRRATEKWENLKNSIYHPLRKHYEYFSYVKSLNHDLRVPLKEGLGEYLLIRQTESAADQAWMMIVQPE